MTPIERLLEKLPDAKKSGNGWLARCPAHDDKRASLSVAAGDDGRALVNCHAGCTVEEVVSAVGLTVRDLMPDRDGPTSTCNGKVKAAARMFPTANAAVAELERQNGKRSALWTYHDAAGNPVGLVVRWDRADGKKDIRPVSRHGDGWRIGAMPEPRPLYALPDLAAANRVIVTEGEKAADAARSLGFVATTSANGAQAAAKTDWRPLAGKEILVMQDYDTPGGQYVDTVAVLLADLTPTPQIKLLDPVKTYARENLPTGFDVADAVAECDHDDERTGLRELIEMAADETVPWQRHDATLPRSEFATGGAGQRRVEPDLVRLSEIEPREVPWLWPGRIPVGRISLLVGRPGAGKSMFTIDVAARMSTGAAWPDGGSAPLSDTLFICAEDDAADTIVPRLIGAGADRRRVQLLKAAKIVESTGKETTVAFDLNNVGLIRTALEKVSDCRLVVIDPVGSYLGGRVDGHRDNEVRGVLAPLALLAAEMNVAIVLVCHTRKAVANFADDAALGSRAFVGISRSVLHLFPDSEDRERKLLLPGKNNLGKPAPGLAYRIVGDPPRLEWESEPLEGMHADDAQPRSTGAEPKRGPEPKVRDAAVGWLTLLLRDGPAPVAEIEEQAKAAGLSWRTVRRAQELLGITPRKRSFSGGWVWELPDPESGHRDSPRGTRSIKPGHLRESPAETDENSRRTREVGQVQGNLANLSANVATLKNPSLKLFVEHPELPD